MKKTVYFDARRLKSLEKIYFLKDFYDNEYPTLARRAIFHRMERLITLTWQQERALINWSSTHNDISRVIPIINDPQYLEKINIVKQSIQKGSLTGTQLLQLRFEMSIYEDSLVLESNYLPAPFDVVVYRGIGHGRSVPFLTMPTLPYPISTSINPKRAVIFAAGGGASSGGLVRWSSTRSSELQVIHVQKESPILLVPHTPSNRRKQEFEILLPPKAQINLMNTINSPITQDNRRILLYKY